MCMILFYHRHYQTWGHELRLFDHNRWFISRNSTDITVINSVDAAVPLCRTFFLFVKTPLDWLNWIHVICCRCVDWLLIGIIPLKANQGVMMLTLWLRGGLNAARSVLTPAGSSSQIVTLLRLCWDFFNVGVTMNINDASKPLNIQERRLS